MPYKANEARRHKIPRARYRVTNWPEYDRALQRRGSLTVWVTPEALAAWHPPRTGRRGRSPRYAAIAIETGHLLRLAFGQPWRKTEGLLRSLASLLGVGVGIPDHRKPFVDPSRTPVTLAHLNACVAAGAAAGIRWKDRAADTVAGIDQMGNYNGMIVKERLPDGRQAVVHLEYVHDDDPFARCSTLMDLYGVRTCVVEINPNYNDAKRFAQRHRGRVFLANYADIADEMLRWGDGPSSRSERRTSDDARDRYAVTLDQYNCMSVSLSYITDATCLLPDPQGLTQQVPEKGVMRTAHPLKDIAFQHLQRVALVAEKDPERRWCTNQGRRLRRGRRWE